METIKNEDGSVTLHFPMTRETLVSMLGLEDSGGITDQQWEDFSSKVDWEWFIKDAMFTAEGYDSISRTFEGLACPVKLYSRKKNECQCNCENHNKWNFFGAYADEEVATERMNDLIFTGNPVWQEKEFKIVDERIPVENV